MEELMKPIEGFDGYYILNLGKAIAIENQIDVLILLCMRLSLNMETIGKNLNVILCSDKGQNTFTVHRIVCLYQV